MDRRAATEVCSLNISRPDTDAPDWSVHDPTRKWSVHRSSRDSVDLCGGARSNSGPLRRYASGYGRPPARRASMLVGSRQSGSEQASRKSVRVSPISASIRSSRSARCASSRRCLMATISRQTPIAKSTTAWRIDAKGAAGREADIAFRYGSPKDSELVARRVARITFGLYASPAYRHRLKAGDRPQFFLPPPSVRACSELHG
jgi:hypothetical protein